MNQETYLVANRRTLLFPLVATLVMTELNPATFIAFTGLGYQFGWWALWLPMVFLIGLGGYAFLVAKKWKSFNGHCVTEFFTKRYSPTVGKLAGLFLFIGMAGFSATYVKSLTLFFIPLLPLKSLWGVSAVIVVTCLIMTLKNGMKAIIRLDVFSFVILSFVLCVIAYYSYMFNSVETINAWINAIDYTEVSQQLPLKFILSLILLTLFTYILAPWYGQKIFSAISESVALKAAIISAVCVFLLYGLAIASTSFLAMGSFNLTESELAFPTLISSVLPQGLQIMALFVFFLIGATTLCGVWSAMSSMLSCHLFGFDGNKSAKTSQTLFCFSAALSFILANTLVDNIFDKLILANIPTFSLSFALLAGFYWPSVTILGVYLSVLVGFIWGTFSYSYWGPEGGYTWYWVVYGLPMIFLSGITGSQLSATTLKRRNLFFKT